MAVSDQHLRTGTIRAAEPPEDCPDNEHSTAPGRDQRHGPCGHQRAHITDSLFHGGGYATPASRRIFCDRCRLQRWLQVEAALTSCQERLGMVAPDTAAQVARACEPGRIDLAALAPEFRRTGHSLVPLLRGLEAACEGASGEMVHLGATTQDIQDTAQALEMREVLAEVDAGVRRMAVLLAGLAVEHRDSLMPGRTHGQPALPITFGLKVASWLDELLRHSERLVQLRPRVLTAQLSGGVGTMAGFDGRGRELLELFAGDLELEVPAVGWHSARDRVAEFGTALAMLTGTLARVADEIRALSRPEVGEVSEGWEYGRVGSSTMPHKRNPERSAQVVLLARLARSNAALGIESMVQEHERDSRGLRMEWVAVADVSHYTLAALGTLNAVLSGLQVDSGRMAANARAAAESLCTEAVMLALAPSIGRQSAHTLVYELSQRAQSEGRRLRDCLLADATVTARFSVAEVDGLLDPSRYLGESRELTDLSVERAREWLAEPERSGAALAEGPRA
ncbi:MULTISPECIES: adenylosuccinate lyase family protein [unclassified Streptomyces]|uniref:class-II fumarase/aspartase family protein n=1 Tax=unclassified Streptomyces TaxID=2593676 RepID=UPI002E137C39|nr:adenylosuccinate lyase family protein [Streptomyces sp. NBC_01197]WSS49697.1 adenylosuccinate lyase family protein [Streptomyces sp. NBC_01180]